MNYLKSIIDLYQATFKDVIDYEKFSLMSISFHSTALEGSSISLVEVQSLLLHGVMPGGKPLVHQQMVTDHHEALLYTLQQANDKIDLTIPMLKQIAGKVLKNTGCAYNTSLGTYDSTKGDYRLNAVRAGDHYFVSYDKVPALVDKLVKKINEQLKSPQSLEHKLNLAFDAHYDLVMIHPFADGNGRTSRLIMNFIQRYFELPIAPVDVSNRNDYIRSLNESHATKSLNPFREFMFNHYTQFLKFELTKFQQSQTQNQGKPKEQSGGGYSMIF